MSGIDAIDTLTLLDSGIEQDRDKILKYLGGAEGAEEAAEFWFGTIVELCGNSDVPVLVNSKIITLALTTAMGLGYILRKHEELLGEATT